MRASLALAAILLFAMASGCDSSTYPQYSGVYELVSVTPLTGQRKPAPEYLGTLKAPLHLKVTHRMEWKGHYWNHVIGFQGMPDADDEAGGGGSFELADLTTARLGCRERSCQMSGVPFRKDKLPTFGDADQTDVWCVFMGYRYSVYAEQLNPSFSTMKRIYLDHEYQSVPNANVVPGAKDGKIPIMLTDPTKAELDSTAQADWENEKNMEGQKITLLVSKERLANYSDCKEFGFPVSDKDTDLGSVELVYKLVAGSADLNTDLRSAGKSDATSFSGGSLWDQVVSFK